MIAKYAMVASPKTAETKQHEPTRKRKAVLIEGTLRRANLGSKLTANCDVIAV